mmetsp:Transcript_22519/g.53156  ORF Transcript_22519/g.53156 Transcript_22519/m.53156 type:complete len:226 (-) Transcript_22519:78-755(-)
MTSSSAPPLSPTNDSLGKSLSLVEAMEAADRIRKFFRERQDPVETEQWVPPGTWQGAATFAATGLLLTPLRGSVLSLAGPRGPFRGFVDLVVTPVLAVGAAQVGLVMGTLCGSSHYLERVAVEAATTTAATNRGTTVEVISIRKGEGDQLSYSPTTAEAAAERDQAVSQLCQQVLSVVPSSALSVDRFPTDAPVNFTFGPWDPRTKTMQSLYRAVENCRRRDNGL